MVFLVVMYGCESWTIRKAERWRIDAFELWCWRRLLRVPWTGKEIQPVHSKGDQPWKFIGRTDAEAETLILWPPDAKNWLLWKDPDAGKDLRQEERGQQRMRWLDGITSLMDMFQQAPGVGDEQGSLACCSPWGLKRVGHFWATELNWNH